ncbi:MAG: hypothetical protein DME97_13745 [Verrucomicrobia bacterium]|nr:MAG: hypothetical protein DME97_13745 [Verrucomicrobiota bacterium]
MRERAAKVNGTRSVFALVTIAAWFCLSNHCALGLALPAPETATTAETGGCPMHSAPAKKMPVSKTPCCKDAIVAKCLTKATPFALRFVGPCDYAAEIFGRRVACIRLGKTPVGHSAGRFTNSQESR